MLCQIYELLKAKTYRNLIAKFENRDKQHDLNEPFCTN